MLSNCSSKILYQRAFYSILLNVFGNFYRFVRFRWLLLHDIPCNMKLSGHCKILFLEGNAPCRLTLNLRRNYSRFCHFWRMRFTFYVLCSTVQRSIGTDSTDKIILSYLCWQVMTSYRHIVTGKIKPSMPVSIDHCKYYPLKYRFIPRNESVFI